MPKAPKFKPWTVCLLSARITRSISGELRLEDNDSDSVVVLTRSEARRLFLKLGGDYKD